MAAPCSSAPRPAARPELLPVFAQAGSVEPCPVPLGRLTKTRPGRLLGEAASRPQTRREHGDLLRAGQRLRQVPRTVESRDPAPGRDCGPARPGVGQHDGIEFYTIGQRKGLRIAAPHPLYVIDLDPLANRVVVGDPPRSNDAPAPSNTAIGSPSMPRRALDATVKIRYNTQAHPPP